MILFYNSPFLAMPMGGSYHLLNSSCTPPKFAERLNATKTRSKRGATHSSDAAANEWASSAQCSTVPGSEQANERVKMRWQHGEDLSMMN